MSKRERKPRVQSSPASQPQQAAESLAGAGGLAAQAFIVRPAGHKRGVRRQWYELERAEKAILALYPRTLPVIVPYSRALTDNEVSMSNLHRKVNRFLRKRGEDEVSRQTVMRALGILREASR